MSFSVQECGGQQLCAQVLLYLLTDYYLPEKPSFLTYDSGVYSVGFSGSCYKLGWDLLSEHSMSVHPRYIKASSQSVTYNLAHA